MARQIGKTAERLALLLLWLKGYRLRHRNWSCSSGELDLVMRRRDTTVFVEVKARSSHLFGGALAAVDRKKQRRIIRTAAAYLGRFGLWERPCRFDVITFERGTGVLGWRLRHIRNAFSPDLGRLL